LKIVCSVDAFSGRSLICFAVLHPHSKPKNLIPVSPQQKV
jgi:hypothetical protein